MNKRLLLINGSNLNLLGKREPEIYGHITLKNIEDNLTKICEKNNIDLICKQSNFEGELITEIQHYGLLISPKKQVDAIIINPAAFTHTSIAIRDAILATSKPFIEVHLSNIHSRESFRHHSYFSDKAIGVICGMGAMGYQMALSYLLKDIYNIDL